MGHGVLGDVCLGLLCGGLDGLLLLLLRLLEHALLLLDLRHFAIGHLLLFELLDYLQNLFLPQCLAHDLIAALFILLVVQRIEDDLQLGVD